MLGIEWDAWDPRSTACKASTLLAVLSLNVLYQTKIFQCNPFLAIFSSNCSYGRIRFLCPSSVSLFRIHMGTMLGLHQGKKDGL